MTRRRENRRVEPLFGLVAAAIAASVAYLVTSERRRAQLRVWRRGGAAARLGGVGGVGGRDLRGGVRCTAAPGTCGSASRGTGRGKYERGHEDRRSPASATARAGCRCAARASGPRSRSASSASGRSRSATPRSTTSTTCRGRPRSPSRSWSPRRGGGSRACCGGGSRSRAGKPVEVDASLADGDPRGAGEGERVLGEPGARPRDPRRQCSTWRAGSSPRRTWPAGSRRTWAASPRRARACGACSCSPGSSRGTRPRAPALLAAREDASEEVRLRAAMALGDEGRETLVDLVTRAGTDDACAARAISALGASAAGGARRGDAAARPRGSRASPDGPGVPRGARAARAGPRPRG